MRDERQPDNLHLSLILVDLPVEGFLNYVEEFANFFENNFGVIGKDGISSTMSTRSNLSAVNAVNAVKKPPAQGGLVTTLGNLRSLWRS